MSSMPTAENITFANYAPDKHGMFGIYAIGATPDSPMGTAAEVAYAFNHTLTAEPDVNNLGELVTKVEAAEQWRDTVPGMLGRLSIEADVVAIARGWSERSGLLEPVAREFASGRPLTDGEHIDIAVITGGIRNGIGRRAARLLELAATHRIGDVLLAGSGHRLGPVGGFDIRNVIDETDYLSEIIAPQIREAGLSCEVIGTFGEDGSEVIEVAANWLTEREASGGRIAVVSHAGAWPQDAGQLRRALQTAHPGFDPTGAQLVVLSGGSPLGTGTEPTSIHQNPFTTAGQIARNLQEFARHVEKR